MLRPRGGGVLAPPRPAHPRRPAPRAPRDDGSRERGGSRDDRYLSRFFYCPIIAETTQNNARAHTTLTSVRAGAVWPAAGRGCPPTSLSHNPLKLRSSVHRSILIVPPFLMLSCARITAFRFQPLCSQAPSTRRVASGSIIWFYLVLLVARGRLVRPTPCSSGRPCPEHPW